MWRRKGNETVSISVFLSRSREIRSTVPLLSSVKELDGDDCCSSVRGDGIISCRL